MQGLERKIC